MDTSNLPIPQKYGGLGNLLVEFLNLNPSFYSLTPSAILIRLGKGWEEKKLNAIMIL